jgi:hypothetical protein
MQGTAADIIKLAMVNTHRRFLREGLKARLILQVHDELIAECPEQETETVLRLLTEEMINAVKPSSIPPDGRSPCRKDLGWTPKIRIRTVREPDLCRQLMAAGNGKAFSPPWSRASFGPESAGGRPD